MTIAVIMLTATWLIHLISRRIGIQKLVSECQATAFPQRQGVIGQFQIIGIDLMLAMLGIRADLIFKITM